MPQTSIIIPSERIVNKIYIIRDRKVMIDRDIATLYGVPTKVLNQAVIKKHQKIPSRLYVSARQKGNGKLEVTNCDIQFN